MQQQLTVQRTDAATAPTDDGVCEGHEDSVDEQHEPHRLAQLRQPQQVNDDHHHQVLTRSAEQAVEHGEHRQQTEVCVEPAGRKKRNKKNER